MGNTDITDYEFKMWALLLNSRFYYLKVHLQVTKIDVKKFIQVLIIWFWTSHKEKVGDIGRTDIHSSFLKTWVIWRSKKYRQCKLLFLKLKMTTLNNVGYWWSMRSSDICCSFFFSQLELDPTLQETYIINNHFLTLGERQKKGVIVLNNSIENQIASSFCLLALKVISTFSTTLLVSAKPSL